MTRRTRPAALLSTAVLLAGAGLTLALAPSAAAVDLPPLGTLSASPAAPVAGDTVSISGTGCLSVPAGAAAAATDAAGTDAAGTAAAPAAPADDTPGSIAITINGPGSFHSTDSATASPDGTWDGDQGITLGDAGTYSVDATCTLANTGSRPGDGGAATNAVVSFDYATLTLEVTAPTPVNDPALSVTPQQAAPGDTISVSGIYFPAAAGSATVQFVGQTQTSPLNSDGGFGPVTFVIPANQGTGTLTGSATAGTANVSFSVSVTAPGATTTPTPPSVDGTVPTLPSSGDTDGSGDTDTTGTDYTSSAPTLPNTGTDTVWPGVLGALLVVAGGGLLWAGRRREDADVTAV